jgi:hypothetical protein
MSDADGYMIMVFVIIPLVFTMGVFGLISHSITVQADYPSQSCIDLIKEERKVLEENPEMSWREDVWFNTEWKQFDTGCASYFDSPQIALDEFVEIKIEKSESRGGRR